jgi:quercetin dioxygenase-like cupin family protein
MFGSVGTPGRASPVPGVELESWSQVGVRHDGRGTAFAMVLHDATLESAHGTYPLPGRSFAVVPGPARFHGGSGLAVTARHHHGLFHIGGPVESSGRLRYIDGCTDTVLVAPVVRGDPCLNLLHLPAGTVQSDHHHPSVRIGLVVAGHGRCVLGGGTAKMLEPGVWFVLQAGSRHRFETTDADGLLLMAWHPDSDSGPTDEDHPMLNRTLRPCTSVRVE